MVERWTEADIGDQRGRVVVVTGASSGIGLETARALATKGAHVVLACRSASKGASALEAIARHRPVGTTELMALDLADLDSVAAFADAFRAGHGRLDVLVNNAGLMAVPRQLTAQGFEMQIGVNHLGHFALTAHLLPMLVARDASRVVNVSSTGHRPGRIDLATFRGEGRYSPWRAYFQSKLANLLFTYELQRRLAAGASTIAVAAHPGGSATNLGHEPAGSLARLVNALRPISRHVLQSAAMGALPTLRAATDPDVAGGEYYGPGGIGEVRGHPVRVGSSAPSHDLAVAAALWAASEELTGVSFDLG